MRVARKELFDNGFGVSIIPEADGRTFEVAVLVHQKKKYAHLYYDSEITDDVIRYCDPEEVNSLIYRVSHLPPLGAA